MRHTEGHFTTPDGICIYTQAWLPDDKPQAILLIAHGLGDHSGRYGNYVDYFVPRGYALYSFDARGHRTGADYLCARRVSIREAVRVSDKSPLKESTHFV